MYNSYMKIVVDADACPVKKEIVKTAEKHGIAVLMVCDTSHMISDSYAEVITVGEGMDAVDFALINHTEKGDIVVSQDYGVASMALARGAKAISNHGDVFTEHNIDSYLTQRHFSKESRRKSGRHYRGPKKPELNRKNFTKNLVSLIVSE